jgi:ABC-2 type transport system ATP-binding protein
MNQGRILIEGGPKEIVHGLEGRILEIVGVPRKQLRTIVERIPGVEDVQLFGDRLHVRIASGSAAAVEAQIRTAAGAPDLKVESVREITPGLEDVFLELLQREGLQHA